MLADHLTSRSRAIVDRWLDLVLESYPEDARAFFKKQTNPFANPVGGSLLRELPVLFEELRRGFDADRLYPGLHNIISVRAVQDLSASQGVGFIFLLKQAVRESLEGLEAGEVLVSELLEFEARVDRLALLGFEIYLQCREKIFEIRANQVKDRTMLLLKRTGLFDIASTGESGPEDGGG